MSIVRSDIRLIKGDVPSLIESIRNFFPQNGYKIVSEDTRCDANTIEVNNIQNSFPQLYVYNNPQIVKLNIKQQSEEYLRVEISCSLFQKFRVLYYFVLEFFLGGSFILMELCGNYRSSGFRSIEFLDTDLKCALYLLTSFLFFFGAVLFVFRSINSRSYENLMEQFYNSIIYKGKIDVHVGHSFPDIFVILFLLLIHFSLSGICRELFAIIFDRTSLGMFFGILILIPIAFCVLLYWFQNKFANKKVLFLLIGIEFSILILAYHCPPIILSIVGPISPLVGSTQDSALHLITMKSVAYLMAIMIFSPICFLIVLNLIQLPDRMIRHINKFSSSYSESYYYQSLNPENKSLLFDVIVVIIWVTLSVTNVLSYYISFSIFELSVFGKNHIVESNFVHLFFENSSAALIIILNGKFDTDSVLLIHKAIMIAYSCPLMIIGVLILLKNIRIFFIDVIFFVRYKIDIDAKITHELRVKLKSICENAKVSMPKIQLTKSLKLVGAKTRFVGFPFFKNFLLISRYTYSELEGNQCHIDALLAHEVWHIKKHNFARRILCFLSDFTLFGNGFLAVIQNSFQIEKEADEFAIRWLLSCGVEKENAILIFQTLLERIEEIEFRNKILKTGSTNLAFLKVANYREKYLEGYEALDIFGKLKRNLSILFQIYFGQEVLSYFHPPNSLRIAWLKEAFK